MNLATKSLSVNFHLWEPCNMRCIFCFATFQDVKKSVLPKGHLSEEEALEVINLLADYGFGKITFVGGEPTLCPWLRTLNYQARQQTLTTMLVTNGSTILTGKLDYTHEFDWVALSVDSLSDRTNLQNGRAITGKSPICKRDYDKIIDLLHRNDTRIKINTVVTQTNFQEDFHEFIEFARPERWKVFQVLPVAGQNDECITDYLINQEEFNHFIHKHQDIPQMVKESNDDMSGSYLMIDPAGRFFDNTTGTYKYSKSILEIGVEDALTQIAFDIEKFQKRGGSYQWN